MTKLEWSLRLNGLNQLKIKISSGMETLVATLDDVDADVEIAETTFDLIDTCHLFS